MRQINGELKFKVHRKPTSNDRYLDFTSCNPINHTVTTIKALQRRAYTICSDEELKAEELNTVRKDLLNNGYPKHLIDKCEKEITKPVYRPENESRNINITTPYIKGVTERISKILKPHNVKILNKTSNNIKNKLCNLKDRRTAENKKNVIYQLKCNDCPAEYIGETGRNAGIRMNEHKRDINNKKISNNMFLHNRNNHHSFNTNQVKIIASEVKCYPRKFVEACHSKFNNNSINRCTEIPLCYLNLIKENI